MKKIGKEDRRNVSRHAVSPYLILTCLFCRTLLLKINMATDYLQDGAKNEIIKWSII